MEEGKVSLMAHSREKLGNGLEIQQAALDQGNRSERVPKTFTSTLSLRLALCPDQNVFVFFFLIQVGMCSHPAIWWLCLELHLPPHPSEMAEM